MRRQRTDEIQWNRLRQEVNEWVAGYGLLSVHIGLYVLAAAILVLVNLYRSPDRFHVQGILFIWGIILLLHIGFVVVRTSLSRATKQVNADWRRDSTRGTRRQPAESREVGGAQPTGRFGAKVGSERESFSLERAKIFVQERVVQPVAARAAPLTTNRREEPPAADPEQATSDHVRETWPHANGAQPTGSMTQRGRALLNSSATHAKDFAERAQSSARDVFHKALGESEPISTGEALPAPKPPAPNWPVAPSPAPTSTPPSNLRNPIAADPMGASPQNGTPLSESSVVFPPYMGSKPTNGKLTERPNSNGRKPASTPLLPPEPPHKTDPKTEWTWMEAAAAAWLARREPDEPPPESRDQNVEPASPPEPAPPDET